MIVVPCIFMRLMLMISAEVTATPRKFKESIRYDYVTYGEIPQFRTDIEQRLYMFNVTNVGSAKLEIFDSGGYNLTIIDYVRYDIIYYRLCHNREFKYKLIEEEVEANESIRRVAELANVESDEGDYRGLMIRHTFADHYVWETYEDEIFLRHGDVIRFKLNTVMKRVQYRYPFIVRLR